MCLSRKGTRQGPGALQGAASATCDKGGPKIADVGAGSNWICMMTFTDNHGHDVPKPVFEFDGVITTGN